MTPSSRAPGVLVTLALLASPRLAAAEEVDPLAGVTLLTPDTLTRVVTQRSSAHAAALADAEASSAATAMAGAWMDPMLTLEAAPISAFERSVQFGGTVRLSQKLPISGRLGLREQAAAHDARAMKLEAGEVTLMLREAALALYAELYATERALALNATHERLLGDLKTSAEQRYATGGAMQADALQAELMLAELATDRLELESRRRALAAKVNGLLQRPTSAPLPPLPEALEQPPALPPLEESVARATGTRPELAALAARADGAQARVALAERGWVPDLEVMASYSSMWMDPAHRFMVGVGVELPLQQAARRGQVLEAQAMAKRLHHQQERLRHELAAEVGVMYAELDEATRRAQLLSTRVLPAARARLEAVRSGYVTGRSTFEAVVEAERSLRDAELKHHLAQADAFKRRAAVDRLLGVTP